MTVGRSVELFESPQAAAVRGAELFFYSAAEAIRRAGRFTVALSGGSTPLPLFQAIEEQAAGSGISWERVHLFWADERCVPPDHPDSNYRLVRENLLARLPEPGPKLSRIRGELPPEEAARTYEGELAACFTGHVIPRFDMIWLGVGADGHTASLFPGTNADGPPGRTAVAVYPTGAKHPRVTLTLPVVNNARHVVFFVTGAEKSEIVAKILQGEGSGRYPAGLASPAEGMLTWLLDREAAGRLDRTKESWARM